MNRAFRTENFAARYALPDLRRQMPRGFPWFVSPILKSHLATLAPGYVDCRHG